MSSDRPPSVTTSASADAPRPVLIIVMGTSGSGKSTLGSQLGSALSLPFIDGDDLHPSTNVEKMSHGTPLTDADREPWLKKIRRAAVELTSPASRHLARGLTKGEHREAILKKFLEVEMDEVDHVRKMAEVYETSAVEEDAPQQQAGHASSSGEGESKFLDSSQHPSQSSSDGAADAPARRGCIIACSALKRSYRQLLRGNITSLADYDTANPHTAELNAPPDLDVYHIYMDISAEILWSRMQARKNHFMKFDMLKSQLDTLEVPVEDVAAAAAAQQGANAEAQRGEPGIVVVPVQEDTGIDEVTRIAKDRIDGMIGRLV